MNEANNFKRIRLAVDKAREAESRANREQRKYLDRLTSTGKFSTNDKKQSDTLDRMRDAEEVEGRAIKIANRLVPKVHLKGGGQGDGKPQGKLRLVQHAAYIQLGDILAEAMMIPKKYLGSGEYIPGPYNSRSRKLDKIKNKLDVAKRDSEAQASREMSPVVASQRAVGIKPRVDAYSIEKKAREDNPELTKKRQQYFRVSDKHNKRLQAFDDKIRAILRNTEEPKK